MPQKFGLYEDLTVLENLTLYADLRNVTGAERRRASSGCWPSRIWPASRSGSPGKLSGGMKQKLGLACSLLGTPRVLLLDEPGVGVDPISRRELWRMVRELAQGGMTVVWSTAYLDEAELCDDVRLMNQGQVMASGTPRGADGRRCGAAASSDGHRRSPPGRAPARPEGAGGDGRRHPGGQRAAGAARSGPACPIWRALEAGPGRHAGGGGAAPGGRLHQPAGRRPGRRLGPGGVHAPGRSWTRTSIPAQSSRPGS